MGAAYQVERLGGEPAVPAHVEGTGVKAVELVQEGIGRKPPWAAGDQVPCGVHDHLAGAEQAQQLADPEGDRSAGPAEGGER